MAVDIATLGIEVQTRGVAQAAAQLRELDRAGARADAAAGQLASQFRGLGAALSVGALLAGARALGRVGDEMENVSARLRLVTRSSAELTRVQSQLFAQSQQSQTSFRANAALYTGLARATEELSVSQEALLTITDGISKAMVVSGTSAAEASGALRQLNQAMESGVLRGDEFNSINEQTPRIMQAIAEGLGISRGELRGWAEAGRLTTERVIPALQKGLVSVEAEFAAMPATISRAGQEFVNAFDLLVQGTNRSTGATAAVASAISGLASNLALVADVVGVVVVAAIGRYVGATASATVAVVTDTIAKRRALAAEVALQQAIARSAAIQAEAALTSGALTAARNAEAAATARAAAASAAMTTGAGVARGALALLGGPLGAIITLLGTAAIAWSAFGDSAEEATGRALTAAEAAAAARARLADLSRSGTTGADELRIQQERLAAARAELDALNGIATRSAAERRRVLAGNIRDIDALVQKLREAQAEANNPQAIGSAFRQFTDATGAFATKAEKDVARINEISNAYVAAVAAIAKARPNIDPLSTNEGAQALERYRTLLGEVQKEIQKAAIAAEGRLREALVESLRAGVEEARTLRTSIAELLAEAAAVRAGTSGAGAKATERRDRGLTQEERDATNRQRARVALEQAQTAAVFAQNAALDGRSQKAEEFAKRSAALLAQASAAADRISDDPAAARIFDEIAEAEAKALEAQAAAKQQQVASIEERTTAQAAELTKLEARVAALQGDATNITVDAETGAAVLALEAVKSAVDAIPARKVIEIAWSVTGAPPSAGAAVVSRAYGGPLPGDDRGDRSDHVLYLGTPGEHVIQRPAVRYYGRNFIDDINWMRLPR